MATRNQRKAKAKARAREIAQAITEQQANAKAEQLVIWKPRQDVFDVPQAIRGHREPIERLGSISRGKFVAKRPEVKPVKRNLVHNDYGVLIERKRGYFA